MSSLWEYLIIFVFFSNLHSTPPAKIPHRSTTIKWRAIRLAGCRSSVWFVAGRHQRTRPKWKWDCHTNASSPLPVSCSSSTKSVMAKARKSPNARRPIRCGCCCSSNRSTWMAAAADTTSCVPMTKRIVSLIGIRIWRTLTSRRWPISIASRWLSSTRRSRERAVRVWLPCR